MKTTFKKSAIAMAVMAFAAGGQALAQESSTVLDVNESFVLTHDADVEKDANIDLTTEADVPLSADSGIRFFDGEEFTTHVSEDVEIDKDLNLELSNVNRDWNEDKDVEHDVEMNWDEEKTVDHDVQIVGEDQKTVEHNVSKTWEEEKLVDHDVNMDHDETKSVRINVTDVEMTKKLSLTKDLELVGDVQVHGLIDVNSASIAVVKDEQRNAGNTVRNNVVGNTAHAEEDVMLGASGNIGLNTAAGDNNLQDNAMATTATDLDSTFGMIDAEIFVYQDGFDNDTTNRGVSNSAQMLDNAMAGATGNIGANIAAGSSNLQKNNMAASVGNGVVAEASVNAQQSAFGNTTTNAPVIVEGENGGNGLSQTVDLAFVSNAITGGRDAVADGSYGCNVGVDCETGDFTVVTGEGDVVNGTYSGSHDGDLRAEGDGPANFEGTLTGSVDIEVEGNGNGGLVEIKPENIASLGGGVLAGAFGNIGVNIAAGTNNIQSNSLSMAVVQPNGGSL